jgi:1,3-beta-glucanosyltransferase GAS1
MKKYRDARGYRKIPIGYSATDTGALRPMLQDYAVCRPDESERMDFYAVNTYSWCGPDTTYNTSGYPQLQELSQNYPVPIWMSEVGCNTVPPRNFQDQNAVFSDPMVDTWSGAMIYEWIQELNHYGLVSYGPALAPSVEEGKRVVQGCVAHLPRQTGSLHSLIHSRRPAYPGTAGLLQPAASLGHHYSFQRRLISVCCDYDH